MSRVKGGQTTRVVMTMQGTCLIEKYRELIIDEILVQLFTDVLELRREGISYIENVSTLFLGSHKCCR